MYIEKINILKFVRDQNEIFESTFNFRLAAAVVELLESFCRRSDIRGATNVGNQDFDVDSMVITFTSSFFKVSRLKKMIQLDRFAVALESDLP